MHLMWNCGFAQEFWRKVGGMLKIVTGMVNLNYEKVVYGINLGVAVNKRLMAWQIISVGKEVLWKCRCVLVSKRELISVDECFQFILSGVYLYFLIDFKNKGECAKSEWKIRLWSSL